MSTKKPMKNSAAKKTGKALSTKKKAPSKALALKGQNGNSTTFFWNTKKYPQVLKDIEAAKGVYDIHVKKGFTAFHLDKGGNKGAPMKEFDPCAGGVLFFKAPSGRYAQIGRDV